MEHNSNYHGHHEHHEHHGHHHVSKNHHGHPEHHNHKYYHHMSNDQKFFSHLNWMHINSRNVAIAVALIGLWSIIVYVLLLVGESLSTPVIIASLAAITAIMLGGIASYMSVGEEKSLASHHHKNLARSNGGRDSQASDKVRHLERKSKEKCEKDPKCATHDKVEHID